LKSHRNFLSYPTNEQTVTRALSLQTTGKGNDSDELPSYPPDRRHYSDVVCWMQWPREFPKQHTLRFESFGWFMTERRRAG